jgi:exonuclease III
MKRSKVLLVLGILLLMIGELYAADISVMTWNIWHGGRHGKQELGFPENDTNSINTLRVLQQHDPDILCMQETYCCGMNVAKNAGYKYSVRGSSNLSIHSKYPIIKEFKLFRAFHSHGVLIDINGKKLLCFNIWLHYLPNYFESIIVKTPQELVDGEGKTRYFEIQQITKEIDSIAKQYPNVPVLIGGDFNSGSHLDWVNETKEYHYNKVVEWPVSKHMYSNDYKDSFREVNHDLESSLQGTWGFLNDNIISDRIDYIYYRGSIIPKSSIIVMDDPPFGFFNSDHRAIKTNFKY